jgi:hypothetical protein
MVKCISAGQTAVEANRECNSASLHHGRSLSQCRWNPFFHGFLIGFKFISRQVQSNAEALFLNDIVQSPGAN